MLTILSFWYLTWWLWFLIYINDLLNYSTITCILMFLRMIQKYIIYIKICQNVIIYIKPMYTFGEIHNYILLQYYNRYLIGSSHNNVCSYDTWYDYYLYIYIKWCIPFNSILWSKILVYIFKIIYHLKCTYIPFF